MKALDRTLQAWAKEYRAQLDPSIDNLIVLAYYDLWHGMDGLGDDELEQYPGFITATKRIATALEDVPGTLYVDTDAECWSETEPGPDECGECCGQGEINQPDDETEECPYCNGSGKVAPFLEETYEVDRAQLVRALVGKELAEYV